MSKIEEVARAMCDGDWNAKSFNETPNGEEPEDLRDYWRDKARAALLAIREPDEGMILAGYKALMAWDARTGEDKGITDVWQAAIDHALTQENGASDDD